MTSQTLQLFDSLVLLAVRYAMADTGSASLAQVQQAMAYLQPPGAEPAEISTALQRLQDANLITACDQQYRFNELAERFWQQSGADKVCGVRVQWQRLHQQLQGFELGSQEAL
ncbi:hypothetical protein [Alkalimonas mucilaginosa]|uniref:Uncharacterized protein n=1 Tax=Alkalimonas mucilaginosa TaxID=3057676 RepID=A0ABU7JJW9_9GAMM|nr:hypothetical protein [Alkalimonas sp. MEB004]MEE2025972.1 hypothetical protein [Alkalimonas sp. MEB004]